MPRKIATTPEVLAERKRRQTGKASAATISRELKIATMTAFNFGDGVKWLLWLKQHKPALFVEILKKCMSTNDEEGPGDIKFIVQQVNIIASPVSGVTNSPIQGHIAAPRLAANNGEIIDAEPADK